MHLVEILIDKRATVNFIDSAETENVIFCRPFEESLHDIATIATKDSEFIHGTITESVGSNYIITTVCLPTGEVYEDVKFKLVVIEGNELPYSTINISALGLPYDRGFIFPPKRSLIKEEAIVPSVASDK